MTVMTSVPNCPETSSAVSSKLGGRARRQRQPGSLGGVGQGDGAANAPPSASYVSNPSIEALAISHPDSSLPIKPA